MEIPEKKGEIKTMSRLCAWWLTTFKGYKVKLCIRSSPKFTIFRTVSYKNTWVLERIDGGNPSSGKRSGR